MYLVQIYLEIITMYWMNRIIAVFCLLIYGSYNVLYPKHSWICNYRIPPMYNQSPQFSITNIHLSQALQIQTLSLSSSNIAILNKSITFLQLLAEFDSITLSHLISYGFPMNHLLDRNFRHRSLVNQFKLINSEYPKPLSGSATAYGWRQKSPLSL